MAMHESVKQHALKLVCEFCRARYPDDMWADYHLYCQMRLNTMTLFKRYASQDQLQTGFDSGPVAPLVRVAWAGLSVRGVCPSIQ